MIRALAAAILALLLLAGAAAAQDGAADVAADAAEVGDEAAAEAPAEERQSWARVVERTKEVLDRETASDFGLERLRAELVGFRDRFLAEAQAGSGREATVRSQLDALGAPPEDGTEEDPRVAARREALQAELARLRAPQLLAGEQAAEASGLIAEIDATLRRAVTSRLLVRYPTVLDPGPWTEALELAASRVATLADEVTGRLASPDLRSLALRTLPGVLIGLAIGAALILGGIRGMKRLTQWLQGRTHRGQGVALFAVSLGFLVLPLLGLILIVAALEATGLFGQSGTAALDAVPRAFADLVVALWVAGSLFGNSVEAPVPLDFVEDRRRRVRHKVIQIGAMASLVALGEAVARTGEATPVALATALLPLHLVLAVLFYRLGQLLYRGATATETDREEAAFRRPLLALVGQGVLVAAAASVLLALVGYLVAARALLDAAVDTLMLLAVLIILQKLVFDLYVAIVGPDAGRGSLLPVLIASCLTLLAVPILALLWGVRRDELAELWSQLQAGFALGETRVSPSDFLTFLLIFATGYALTRLVQGGLRSTLLPRTKLDIGARNAIVVGTGYVGIFLAGLVAVISAGINLSSLAFIAGALSLGIGFGLQNIVQNFVSGIILLIERPISEGDWIEVNGQMGYVRDISVRSTRIETFDRTDVIVPNADLVSGQVTNWTRGNLVGRVIVPVGVAYGTDTDRVAAILREIAEAHPMVVLTPPPGVLFRGFGASSLDFEIRAILRDVNFVLQVQSEMNHEIARRFAEAGIEIPFPQQDLWLRNPETLRPKPEPAPESPMLEPTEAET